MDQNVLEFEKKLSDFERMFLFINAELDFEQLGKIAQQVEDYKENLNSSRKLSIRDMYGFIQMSVPKLDLLPSAQGGRHDSWSERISDRHDQSDASRHGVRYRK